MIGIVAVGTLFSAMAVNTRLAELLLPMLSLPFFVPVLMCGRRRRRGSCWATHGRDVAVAEDSRRVRHRVRRRVHARVSLYARRMTPSVRPLPPTAITPALEGSRSSIGSSRSPCSPWSAYVRAIYFTPLERFRAPRRRSTTCTSRRRSPRTPRWVSRRSCRSCFSGCATSARTAWAKRAPKSDWCFLPWC